MMAVLAIACLSPTLDPPLDVDRLIAAFAQVESSNRPQVFGDGGKSWGLYQFQVGRWRECGGDARKWGKAETGADYQTRIMRNAIERYQRRMPRGLTTEQRVCWLGRAHNGGPRTIQHNEYTKKLWREYKKGS